MVPVKPYMLHALYAWMTDNGWTPHLVVDAARRGVIVPQEYVNEDKIVLNISKRAVRDLRIEMHQATFSTRFRGVAHEIILPMAAILAVYAEENGQGLTFPSEDGSLPEPAPPSDSMQGSAKPGSHLRLVKK